jgi:hypothetical protein
MFIPPDRSTLSLGPAEDTVVDLTYGIHGSLSFASIAPSAPATWHDHFEGRMLVIGDRFGTAKSACRKFPRDRSAAVLASCKKRIAIQQEKRPRFAVRLGSVRSLRSLENHRSEFDRPYGTGTVGVRFPRASSAARTAAWAIAGAPRGSEEGRFLAAQFVRRCRVALIFAGVNDAGDERLQMRFDRGFAAYFASRKMVGRLIKAGSRG